MATLIARLKGRTYDVTPDSRTAVRAFVVRSASITEAEPLIISAVGIAYGTPHPNNANIFAREFSAQQDEKVWWKWVVTITYNRPDLEEDSGGDINENPLDREPDISYNTESITVAARGEVDSSGTITKALVNSAKEPYDPPPEEELEILVINIVRWEAPNFSLDQYYDYQNAVNDNSFTFGDKTIDQGEAKIRIRIGPTETYTDPDDNLIQYRQYEYTLAVSPIGWDIEILDWGTFYLSGGNAISFRDTDNQEFGLLDGSGGKLGSGASPVYNKWENKRRVSFAALNLPAGP